MIIQLLHGSKDNYYFSKTVLYRSSVQESAGTRSMVATAVSAFVLFWVLLFAGPVFAETPLVRLSEQASGSK